MNLVIKTKLLFTIFIILGSYNLQASVPDGFEDLASTQEAEVRMYVNDNNFIIVKGEIGNNGFKLLDNQINSVQKFLSLEYLTIEAIKTITSQLKSGVYSSSHCQGRRDSCFLDEEMQGELQYVVGYSQKIVRILVPDALTSSTVTRNQYINESAGQNALILHHDLGVGGASGADARLYYQNQATAAVFDGYISSNISIDSDHNVDDNPLTIDELSYNKASKSERYRLGFMSDNINRSWNGTSLLNTDERINALTFEYGNTRELEFKNEDNSQRYYFTVSSSGRLFVERLNGNVILERNVKAGQTYVSYSDLPSGINSLVFRVLVGEKELYRETVKIYNNSRSAIETGDWDYSITAGKLYNEDIGDSKVNEYYDDKMFFESKLATQVIDGLRLGIGAFTTEDDYYLKTAIEYEFSSGTSVNVIYGDFNDGSRYFQSSFSFKGLNVDWSKYTDNSENNYNNPNEITLSNYFYQVGSSENLTFNWSKNIGPGNTYINYSMIENELPQKITGDSSLHSFTKYNSLMFGYSFYSLFNSTIDINATRFKTEGSFVNNEDSEWSFNLALNVPFGLKSRANYNFSNSNGISTQRASLAHDYDINGGSLSGEAGIAHFEQESLDSFVDYDLSASANYSNKALSTSAFVYGNSNNTYSINASLESSTIITDGDIFHSPQSADSYLLIKNKGEVGNGVKKGGDKFLSVVALKNNGEYDERYVIDDEKVIQPLENFREYQVVIDDESSDYVNKGEQVAEGSSYPGTVVKLDVDMREVGSYISIFNDIEGNPIKDITCIGNGCISVDELYDGVFKFKVALGQTFSLRSKGKACVIPSSDQFTHQNIGENFCMPEFQEENGIVVSQGENGYFYYYIGEFTNNKTVENYMDKLGDESITLVEKQVGNRNFIFLESKEVLGIGSLSIIEEFQSYALKDNINESLYTYKR